MFPSLFQSRRRPTSSSSSSSNHDASLSTAGQTSFLLSSPATLAIVLSLVLSLSTALPLASDGQEQAVAAAEAADMFNTLGHPEEVMNGKGN